VASPVLYVWRGKKGSRLIKASMLTKQPAKEGAAKSLAAPAPAQASGKPAPASPKAAEPTTTLQASSAKSGPDKSKKGKKGKKARAKA
jgi:hypothetical protein